MRWPRRRRAAWMVVLAAVLIVVGVLVWFQPQKLLIDQRVDEALPVAVSPGGTEAGGTTPPAARPEPVTLAAGEFRSLGHATTGRAVVLELGDGTRLLRLEGLRTSNGPDLFVYLSATLAEGPRQAFDQGSSALRRAWLGGRRVPWLAARQRLPDGWPHDQVQGRNTQPGRVIWSLETADVRSDFERLRAAGATVVQEPYQPGEAPQGGSQPSPIRTTITSSSSARRDRQRGHDTPCRRAPLGGVEDDAGCVRDHHRS